MSVLRLFSLSALCLLVFAFPAAAQAATITVDTTADPGTAGDCSLRAALTAVENDAPSDACTAGSGEDVIEFSATGAIELQSALPTIGSDVTISGPGVADLEVSRVSGGDYRIFEIDNGSVVTINDIAISGGKASDGGGIYNSGDLVLTRARVSSNEASDSGDNVFVLPQGGGIYNASGATLEVNDSVINMNSVSATATGGSGFAVPSGGGIYSEGALTINDTEISGNDVIALSVAFSEGDGGGIMSRGAATIASSTIAENELDVTSGGNALVNGAGVMHNPISDADTINIERSTIVANVGTGDGHSAGIGAIRGVGLNLSGTSGEVSSTTIVANSGVTEPAGFVSGANVHFNSAGDELSFQNSVIADPSGGVNCDAGNGDIVSNGYNLLDGPAADFECEFGMGSDQTNTEPLLGSLTNNGGPTRTLKPAPNSPLVDQGLAAGETVDQRGLARPVDFSSISNASGGDGTDIGAFELHSIGSASNSAFFPGTQVGENSSAATIEIDNEFGAAVDLDEVVLGGTNPADFSVGADSCSSANLADGASCEVEVVFAPQDTGIRTATLTLSDDVGVTVSVSLFGTGLAVPTPSPPEDTTAPQVEIISVKVNKKQRSAKARFGANEAASFECRIDNKAFVACTSPATFKKLRPGRRSLSVRATDLSGNTSVAVKKNFTVPKAKKKSKKRR